MKKTILVFLAMGALSCALFSQQAQAAAVTGEIHMAGDVIFDIPNLGAATTVNHWISVQNILEKATTFGATGDFTNIPTLTEADMAHPWVFDPSTPTAPLWSVTAFGFSFDLTSVISVTHIGNIFINVRARGIIHATGFDDTEANFSFTVNNPDGQQHYTYAFAAAISSALPPATDFDHNGKPDYVLYNGGTRQTAVWFMNNNIFLYGLLGPTLPAGWNLIDVGDFDADGKPDYALFNPSTRQTAILYLSGVTLLGGALGPTIASGYQLTAVADFNEDGYPDYVLYNRARTEQRSGT